MKKKLRVAIIGQGRSGRDIHGKYFLTDPGRFQVAAVVDLLEERRKKAAAEYHCDVYENYQDLFGRSDIDFVVNSSFSHMHCPISIDLLDHGFHVLSEKPCARTPEEVQTEIDAAKRNNRMFTVFQQSRFAPYFEKVKSLLDSGVLGRTVQISIAFSGFARRWDWQCLQCYNGGSLYNTGPHPVDQALYLLNDFEGKPEVFCRMDRANSFGDAEDYVKLILTMPGRPLVDLEISSCDAFPQYTYKIQGTRGGLRGNMTEIEWKYFSEADAPERELDRTPLFTEDRNPAYCTEKLIWTHGNWKLDEAGTFTHAVRRYYDTIYDHLVNGAPLVVTAAQVKQQIDVMRQCHLQNPLPVLFDL